MYSPVPCFQKNSRGSTNSTKTLPARSSCTGLNAFVEKSYSKLEALCYQAHLYQLVSLQIFSRLQMYWNKPKCLSFMHKLERHLCIWIKNRTAASLTMNHSYLSASHSFVQSQKYLLIFLISKGHIMANPLYNYSCDWKKLLGTHKFCLPTLRKKKANFSKWLQLCGSLAWHLLWILCDSFPVKNTPYTQKDWTA